jgi:hypothetical protein
MHPEHRSIGELAYHIWQARGCPEGSAEQDWLDAEKQLKGPSRTIESRTTAPRATEPRTTESRATESASSNAIDNSLKATFPASDPPASQRADEPPANADAKWKAAASRKGPSAPRPRQSKTTPGKPSAKPPG